jgi:VWFA-related protein
MPTIKVATRLVQVNVVVHDKNGKPVQDLAKEDFVLYDQGEIQEISTFSKITDNALPANSAPLPPDVVSNRLANSTGPGPAHSIALPNAITVFFIDRLNTNWVDHYYAKIALIKFLEQIQPGDRVAIYALTNGLRVLHDFSADTASLLTALDHYKKNDSFLVEASSQEDSNTGFEYFDSLNKSADEHLKAYYIDQRIKITLDALTTIAKHLKGIPGRKSLLWLSSSVPLILNSDHYFYIYNHETQRTLNELNDAGIAIYPIDPRGLIGAFAYFSNLSPALGGKAATNNYRDILSSQDTMIELAKGTGGRAFMNTNDIVGAIRKAVEDTRVSYVLGYSPNNQNWDGKYREIKLKLKRPGLEARYRQGYFATPELGNTKNVREQALEEAVNAPLLASGLGITAKIAMKPTEHKAQTTIEAVLDARELIFHRKDNGEQEAALDMVATVFDDQRQPLSQIVRIVRFSIKPVQFTQNMDTTLSLNIEVNMPAKADRVRLVFRDLESGTVGSVDVNLAKLVEKNGNRQ